MRLFPEIGCGSIDRQVRWNVSILLASLRASQVESYVAGVLIFGPRHLHRLDALFLRLAVKSFGREIPVLHLGRWIR